MTGHNYYIDASVPSETYSSGKTYFFGSVVDQKDKHYISLKPGNNDSLTANASWADITNAQSRYQFSVGDSNITIGDHVTAIGRGLVTKRQYQTVLGCYNMPNNEADFVVGGGKSAAERKNILTVAGGKATADIDQLDAKNASIAKLNSDEAKIKKLTSENAAKGINIAADYVALEPGTHMYGGSGYWFSAKWNTSTSATGNAMLFNSNGTLLSGGSVRINSCLFGGLVYVWGTILADIGTDYTYAVSLNSIMIGTMTNSVKS